MASPPATGGAAPRSVPMSALGGHGVGLLDEAAYIGTQHVIARLPYGDIAGAGDHHAPAVKGPAEPNALGVTTAAESKSEPAFPPLIGMPVSAFARICSKPRNVNDAQAPAAAAASLAALLLQAGSPAGRGRQTAARAAVVAERPLPDERKL
jgi:hypothetical protein